VWGGAKGSQHLGRSFRRATLPHKGGWGSSRAASFDRYWAELRPAQPEQIWRVKALYWPIRNRQWQSRGQYHKTLPNSPAEVPPPASTRSRGGEESRDAP
jgi:hypothetical protein